MPTMTEKKQLGRKRRQARARKKIHGTTARPRLAVFRSNKHIVAQLIDDSTGRTVAAASSHEAAVKGTGATGNVSASAKVGTLIAERAKAAGHTTVVFDRGGFIYHGRIAAVADAARAAGLEF
jgi:large subunit ribosomal protein L18